MTRIRDVADTARAFLRVVRAWEETHEPSLDPSLADARLIDEDLERVDHAVSDLQDGIQEARRIYIRVAEERNSKTPIGRVVVELLRDIFDHYACASGHMENSTVAHPGFLLASVCKRWRAVALSYPALWSRVNLSPCVSQLDYIRERAADYPWTLVYYPGGEAFQIHNLEPRIRDFLLDNISRTQDLTVIVSKYWHELDILKEIMSSVTAPLLQRCSIHYGEWSTRHSPPSRLFNGCAPRLRHFKARFVDLLWDTAYLGNLTSLAVTHCHVTIPQHEELCSVLKASPDLEVLVLDCVPLNDSPFYLINPCGASRFELGRLHTLKLTQSPEEIHYILSSLSFPSLRILELEATSVDAEYVPRLCQLGVFPPTATSSIAHLSVTVDPPTEPDLYNTVYIEGFEEAKTEADRVLLLSWNDMSTRPDADTAALRRVICDLRSHIPDTLHSLTLQSSVEHEEHPLDALLGLRSVKYLTLEGVMAGRFAERVLGPQAFELGNIGGHEELVEVTLLKCRLRAETLLTLLERCAHCALRVALQRVTVLINAQNDEHEFERHVSALAERMILRRDDVRFRCTLDTSLTVFL